MLKLRYFSILGLAVTASCGIPPDTSKIVREDETVKTARSAMIGMSEADVRMCAGFPTSGVMVNPDEKIWTYQRSYSRGTLNVGVTSLGLGAVPGMTGAAVAGSEGFCNTQIRFANGKVDQVEFAGDNNTTTKINGLCVSTVDECVVYAKTGRKPAGMSARAPMSVAPPVSEKK